MRDSTGSSHPYRTRPNCRRVLPPCATMEPRTTAEGKQHDGNAAPSTTAVPVETHPRQLHPDTPIRPRRGHTVSVLGLGCAMIFDDISEAWRAASMFAE